MSYKEMKHTAAVVLLLGLVGLVIDSKVSNQFLRRMSIEYENGDCEWTGSEKVDLNLKPYGTLFASYPGAGMRLTWQMTEGVTGLDVGDDFFYSGKLGGIVKTQFPHPEGIWSYRREMDQVILLVRNPRWNIPSYHTLLYELEYAHDYVVAYDNVYTAFSTRAPMDNWIKWRDYRFEDEINLWAWQIDFYMENGPQFWDNLDYERAGQYPFRYKTEAEKPWPTEEHCANDITETCKPKAVISYEKLKDPYDGPDELRKIADLIRDKKAMDSTLSEKLLIVSGLRPDELRKIADLIRDKKAMDSTLSDKAINCIWLETWEKAPEPRNEDRDAGGITAGEYLFSIKQMSEIMAKLIFMKNKYSNGVYVLDLPARDLVRALHTYINQVGGELGDMYKNPPPTPAPSVGSAKALVDWYNTIGRGNRHDELRKIADLIRDKKAMDSTLSDKAINCIWLDTWDKAPEPRNEDRDAGGIQADEYLFSIHQMEEIMAKLLFMKNKYSTGEWVLVLPARDLVRNLHMYIQSVAEELGGMYKNPPPTQAPSVGSAKALVVGTTLLGEEMGGMYKNPPPTQAPSVGSAKALVDWYNTIGRGNRHAKDIVQHMASYWGLVEDLYEQEPTPAPTPCPTDFTGYNLTDTEQEWLDQHNIRRTAFFELKGLPPKNLTWSRDLQTSAENYAQKLADEAEPTAEAGCWLPNRLGGDQYGTQNTAMNRGLEIATPTNLLESWYDNEIDFTTEFPNITLHGPKFHATQVIFRSSKYVGCGQATKTNPANGEICNFHVCRYLGPGNCFLEAFTDVYTSFHSLFQEEDCMSKPEHADNYWICSVMSDHASEICQDPPELPVKPKDECIALMTAVQEEATV
eukprot:CAMPEP_0194226858 /NCGR_PEP_ID=MMETSP0156-20130528/42553_1 /TAXON_ID=33649 /ORGANISM="Thalassionema nitzschioides, Strain L26-B" /LENGTH=858 /DNA_ID=CAMNT_0038959323 /DNA_START=129 /DNA_END=2707 /DNA_ORIENTATION=-